MGTRHTPDQKTCIRILARLRSGVAPREAIEYVSVGLDEQIQLLRQSFGRERKRGASIFAVEAPYGEGKSHLLRLTESIAEHSGYAATFVVHNHKTETSLHRPSILFRSILREVEWRHPEADLWRYYWEMSRGYSYWHDRSMRSELPSYLRRLADALSQSHRGLIVIIDELENMALLHHKSYPIAYEVLSNLCDEMKRTRKCRIVFATTPYWGRKLGTLFGAERLSSPSFTETLANELFHRLCTIHHRAYAWRHLGDADTMARHIYDQAVAQAPVSQWRAFVQWSVHALDIAHASGKPLKKLVRHVGLPMGGGGHAVGAKGQLSRVRVASSAPMQIALPTKMKPRVAVGEVVEITAGPMRGWEATVEDIKEGKLIVGIGRGASVTVGPDKVRRKR